MNKEIIEACETVSEGDAKSVANHIAPGVRWEIVGEKSIEGLDALLKFCEEMTSEGCPDFRNQRTTIGDSQIVVEGSERKEGGILYCDSYRIEDSKITEIRSYCIMPEKK